MKSPIHDYFNSMQNDMFTPIISGQKKEKSHTLMIHLSTIIAIAKTPQFGALMVMNPITIKSPKRKERDFRDSFAANCVN